MDLFFILFILCLDTYLLFHVYKLNNDNCKCSENSKLDLIKYYLVFSILFSSIQLYFFTTNKKIYYKYKNKGLILLVPLSIVYAYITYLYTLDLKNSNCTCINSLYISILYFTSLFISFIFSFTGLIVVFFLVLVAMKRKS